MNWSNIGRIGFGLGYLVAALFNLTFTLRNYQSLWDWFLENVYLAFYQDLLVNIIIPNASLFIILTVILEIFMGVLILNKLLLTKIGLVLGLLWAIFLIPMFPFGGPEMATNIILAVVQAILLRKEYETTFLEMLRTRF